MNEQIPQVDNHDFGWMPISFDELHREASDTQSSYTAITEEVEGLLVIERTRLDAFEATAEGHIEEARRRLEEFIVATNAVVLGERERSNVTVATILDEVTTADGLKQSYMKTGEILVNELKIYEAILSEKTELEHTTQKNEAELAKKRLDQTLKSEESLDISQQLNEATEQAVIAYTDMKRLGGPTSPFEPIGDYREMEDINKRAITKQTRLDDKRSKVVTEVGILSIEIYELETVLSVIGTDTYPALVQKIEAKRIEILAYRQQLTEMSAQMASYAAGAKTIEVLSARAIPEQTKNSDIKGITDVTGDTAEEGKFTVRPSDTEVLPASRASRHRVATFSTGMFPAEKKGNRYGLFARKVLVITNAEESNQI